MSTTAAGGRRRTHKARTEVEVTSVTCRSWAGLVRNTAKGTREVRATEPIEVGELPKIE
jgi:hypothetical protein